jgi:hypothetical protein
MMPDSRSDGIRCQNARLAGERLNQPVVSSRISLVAHAELKRIAENEVSLSSGCGPDPIREFPAVFLLINAMTSPVPVTDLIEQPSGYFRSLGAEIVKLL